MTFDQIHIPEGADEAMEWACEVEFELRYQHMRRSKLGLTGVLRETTVAMGRSHEKLAGDSTLDE